MSTRSAPDSKNLVKDRSIRSWIYGFFLLGVLIGPIGSLLIAWQYHIDTNPEVVGLHFLALNAGYVAAEGISRRLLLRFPMRLVAVASCVLGFASLLSLCFVVPPVSAVWRIAGLGLVGLAAGGLSASLLYILEPYFSRSTASAVSSAGSWLGFGCTADTAVVAATYFAGSVQIETAVLAAIPLFFAFYLAQKGSTGHSQPFGSSNQRTQTFPKAKKALGTAVILFALLIFFQSGNEWVLAGWLPLFLIQRLGANPVLAVLALATYFLALTGGRVLVRRFLVHVHHRWLLLASVFLAMAGYLLLSLTPSLPFAFLAVIMAGLGLAPTYPLLAKILDDRFAYHAGFYHRLFSIALTGAMSVPWLIGYVDALGGARYIMLVPAFGSLSVMILTLLIMFEAHLGRNQDKDDSSQAMTAAGGRG